MKKFIALLLACLICFSFCACGTEKQQDTWSIKQTVDEFGDVTENSAEVITGVFEGTFSNTATAGSELSVIVSIGRKAKFFSHYLIGFDLKEYNNTTATYLSSDTKIFKVKINEEIIEMDLSGSAPNGTLYLSSEDYECEGDIIFNELLKGNDVRCIINIGSSEYNFTLNSDNFVSLCNGNNFTEGSTELTVAEAVYMLLTDEYEYTETAEELINSNTGKYELLNSSGIKKYLEGRFLQIGPGYTHINKHKVNVWEILDISPKNGTSTAVAQYIMSEYTGQRSLSYLSGKPLETSFENDAITKYFVYNGEDCSATYQCRKITDNIFMLSILSEGSFIPSSLLLRMNNTVEEADIDYMINNYIGAITF